MKDSDRRYIWEGPALYVVLSWAIFPVLFLVAKALLGLVR